MVTAAGIIRAGTGAPVVARLVAMMIGGDVVAIAVRAMVVMVLVVRMGAGRGLVCLIAKHSVFPPELLELILSCIRGLFKLVDEINSCKGKWGCEQIRGRDKQAVQYLW